MENGKWKMENRQMVGGLIDYWFDEWMTRWSIITVVHVPVSISH